MEGDEEGEEESDVKDRRPGGEWVDGCVAVEAGSVARQG